MSAALDIDGLAALRTRGCCRPLAEPIDAATAARLAALHKALAEATRLQMLHMLKAAAEPICVCDFTAAFDLAQPTVSHHLGRLRDAGLVASEKRGVWAFYRLREDMPEEARRALELVP